MHSTAAACVPVYCLLHAIELFIQLISSDVIRTAANDAAFTICFTDIEGAAKTSMARTLRLSPSSPGALLQ